jgi:hypothetical protein
VFWFQIECIDGGFIFRIVIVVNRHGNEME